MALRMQREVVVFPHPLSPTSDSVCPRLRKKVTSSTAFTWPTVFCRKPLRMGKYFLSPLTSRSTGLPGPALLLLIAVRVLSLVEKATCLPSFADRHKQRLPGVAAAGHKVSASGVEGATRRSIERMGNRPADGRKLDLGHGVDAGNRLQKGLRIGVLRIVKNLIDLALLDHPAQVHDDHVVGHLRDHAEVVRDEHDGHPPFLLDLAQQIQNLR